MICFFLGILGAWSRGKLPLERLQSLFDYTKERKTTFPLPVVPSSVEDKKEKICSCLGNNKYWFRPSINQCACLFNNWKEKRAILVDPFEPSVTWHPPKRRRRKNSKKLPLYGYLFEEREREKKLIYVSSVGDRVPRRRWYFRIFISFPFCLSPWKSLTRVFPWPNPTFFFQVVDESDKWNEPLWFVPRSFSNTFCFWFPSLAKVDELANWRTRGFCYHTGDYLLALFCCNLSSPPSFLYSFPLWA